MALQAAEDDILARLAAFVAARQAQPADAFARTAAAGAMALRLADALACALAAHKGDALHALAADFGDARGPAQVFGGGRASLENAAFLNCVMIRELDWNDTYIGKNGGHPSDFSGGALFSTAPAHSCCRRWRRAIMSCWIFAMRRARFRAAGTLQPM
ncbi:MAG: hypothetical protein FJX29_02010 [Alphaproteobacteria bacterium]|nr:hypothetical protein [Alphaproteobacteria bacterium]